MSLLVNLAMIFEGASALYEGITYWASSSICDIASTAHFLTLPSSSFIASIECVGVTSICLFHLSKKLVVLSR